MRPIPATFILAYVTLCVSSSLEAQLRGVPTQNIDRTTNACTDFDAYANGQWRAEHPMPATQSNWAIRTVTLEQTRVRLRTIAEDDAAKSEGLQLGSAGRLTGDFYASCIGQSRVDSLGVKPLEAYQKVIDNVHDTKTLSVAIIRLQQIRISAPLEIQPLQDPHEPTRVIADVSIAGLGMPDRDYYLRDEDRFSSVRQKYVAYAKKLLALAGTPTPDAERIAAAVMKIETALARDGLTRVERRNPKAEDHPMSFVDLKLLAPRFDWDEEFRTLGLSKDGQLNVSQPKLTQTFDALLESASLEEWRAYLHWSLLNSSAEYLSSAIEQARFDFYGTALTGSKEPFPRWQRCVVMTDRMLGEALGHEYVDRYLPPTAKARAHEMAVNIVNELKASIQTRDWMSAPTKMKALEKMNALNIKIGYPDKWKDYAGVKLDRGAYYENVLSSARYSVRDRVNQIGKPVDRDRWNMTPPTMNAYYNPLMNEIVVPAGYLQPPGFDPNGLDAINYGAVGVSIGHEISHSVDDEGAQFAADGRLENWWTEVDYKNFEARTACTTAQYDSYFVEPNLHLQGKLVTGEALGDLGGVNLAYRAYKKSRAGRGPEPSVDGFTPDQQFFLAEAQWRGAIVRPEAARTLVSTDPHPPGHFRVIGPLSNMPEFQEAFQCKESDAMERPAVSQCKIW